MGHSKLMCKLRIWQQVLFIWLTSVLKGITGAPAGGEVGCWGLGKSGGGR